MFFKKTSLTNTTMDHGPSDFGCQFLTFHRVGEVDKQGFQILQDLMKILVSQQHGNFFLFVMGIGRKSNGAKMVCNSNHEMIKVVIGMSVSYRNSLFEQHHYCLPYKGRF